MDKQTFEREEDEEGKIINPLCWLVDVTEEAKVIIGS